MKTISNELGAAGFIYAYLGIGLGIIFDTGTMVLLAIPAALGLAVKYVPQDKYAQIHN